MRSSSTRHTVDRLICANERIIIIIEIMTVFYECAICDPYVPTSRGERDVRVRDAALPRGFASVALSRVLMMKSMKHSYEVSKDYGYYKRFYYFFFFLIRR